MTTGLMYSPLSEDVYWGRTNKNGVSSGSMKNVTSNFLQVMEMKFPINTSQNISVNSTNKYRVIVVAMDRKVEIDGNLIE
jgi:hypothetical protein